MVDTVPRLVRSKQDLIAFFRGAGVSSATLDPLSAIVRQDRTSINKFEIARQIIHAVNAQGPVALQTRREIIKRIVEFTQFDQCYPNDSMAARGGVSAIAKFVNLKDSVTKTLEVAREQRERSMVEAERRTEAIRQRRADREAVSKEFARLFTLTAPVERGKALEALLNRLFAIEGVAVREAFRIVSAEGNGVIEQIDGVIEFDGNHYLVEIKWWSDPLGVGDVSQHMVRVFARGQSRGLLIVHPGFTGPAVESATEMLQKAPFILAVLEELVHVFRTETTVVDWLRAKVTASIADKDPFRKFTG